MFWSAPKIRDMLCPVKDDIALTMPGVYGVPCECGSMYIRQTIHIMSEHCTEHKCQIKQREFDKSAIAKHCLENRHKIPFEKINVLAHASTYWDFVIKELAEI